MHPIDTKSSQSTSCLSQCHPPVPTDRTVHNVQVYLIDVGGVTSAMM